jgi:hypothetical protein
MNDQRIHVDFETSPNWRDRTVFCSTQDVAPGHETPCERLYLHSADLVNEFGIPDLVDNDIQINARVSLGDGTAQRTVQLAIPGWIAKMIGEALVQATTVPDLEPTAT